MGPAPMIRMVEMSVLLGIKSRGTGKQAQKKGALPRVPFNPALGIKRAGGL
jgi:hypothetical protein